MINALVGFMSARLHEEHERPATLKTIASLIPDGRLLFAVADQIEADTKAKWEVVAGCAQLGSMHDEGMLHREALLVVEYTLRSLASAHASHPSYRPEWGLTSLPTPVPPCAA